MRENKNVDLFHLDKSLDLCRLLLLVIICLFSLHKQYTTAVISITADLFIGSSNRKRNYPIALGFKVHSQLDLEEHHTILKSMCKKILSNKLDEEIKKLHHCFMHVL